MTLLAYFNSLRELGGARRIVEEEVQNTLKGRGGRRRLGEKTGLFRDRSLRREVLELTSRETTDKVASAFQRLASTFDKDDRVDCALATNMISVGLDVSRLGLMVVCGQPKTHSEYIQATSRVGRADDKPRSRGHAAELPQGEGPFPLRAFPPLPRDLLPLGGTRLCNPVRGPCAGPGVCRRARCPRPSFGLGAYPSARC